MTPSDQFYEKLSMLLGGLMAGNMAIEISTGVGGTKRIGIVRK